MITPYRSPLGFLISLLSLVVFSTLCLSSFSFSTFNSSLCRGQVVVAELEAGSAFSTWGEFSSSGAVETGSGDIVIDVQDFGGITFDLAQVDFPNFNSVIEVELKLEPGNVAGSFVVNLTDSDGTGGDGLEISEIYQYSVSTNGLSSTQFETVTINLDDYFFHLNGGNSSTTPDDDIANYGLISLGMQSNYGSTDRLSVAVRRVSIVNTPIPPGAGNVVTRNGRLQVSGNRVMNKFGTPACLAGCSIFWSNWFDGSQFYVPETAEKIADDWNASIIRAAMGVEASGGYADNGGVNATREMNKVKTIVDAAIANDIYVIIDFHSHAAEQYTTEAVTFFDEMSSLYGGYDNVIYEVYNEPVMQSWSTIKTYAETVIATIRQNDPDNLIVVGTPFYSQNVDVASLDPISDPNVVYTLHFYAGTHGASLRAKATTAMNNGIPLFVTEWGSVDASGNGAVDYASTNTWMEFCRDNDLCHANWSITDKNEGSAIIAAGTGINGLLNDNLTASGNLVLSIVSDWANFVGKPPVDIVVPESANVVRGNVLYGGFSEMAVSDNDDLTVSRNALATAAIVEVEIKSTTIATTPSNLIFTIESSVFARRNITQRVELYDYNADAWEIVDSRNASRTGDITFALMPAGDVSRFIQPGTGCVEARIRYSSPINRVQFSAGIDQVIWEFE